MCSPSRAPAAGSLPALRIPPGATSRANCRSSPGAQPACARPAMFVAARRAVQTAAVAPASGSPLTARAAAVWPAAREVPAVVRRRPATPRQAKQLRRGTARSVSALPARFAPAPTVPHSPAAPKPSTDGTATIARIAPAQIPRRRGWAAGPGARQRRTKTVARRSARARKGAAARRAERVVVTTDSVAP